jgi:hypothetical protein
VITRHQSKQAKRQMNIGEMQILNQTLRTDSLFGLVKSRAGTQQILQSWYVCTLRSTCVHVQLLDAAACRCCMHARIYSVAVTTAQGYIVLWSPPRQSDKKQVCLVGGRQNTSLVCGRGVKTR